MTIDTNITASQCKKARHTAQRISAEIAVIEAKPTKTNWDKAQLLRLFRRLKEAQFAAAKYCRQNLLDGIKDILDQKPVVAKTPPII